MRPTLTQVQQAQMSPIPEVGVQKSDPLGMGSGDFRDSYSAHYL